MNYNSLLTVVTPATDYALVDLDTVKDELNVTDTSLDTRLTRWTLEVSSAIQAAIGGRVLRSETVSQTFRAKANATYPDSHGEHFYPRYGGWGHNDQMVAGLRLWRYPVSAVTSIVEDGNTLDPAADYEIDAQAGLIYRLDSGFRVAWYGLLIVVIYAGGYVAPADVPGDLQTACLLLLKHRRAAQSRDPMLKQESIPGVIERQFWVGSTIKGDSSTLPPEVEDLVQHYRDVHA